MPPRLLPRPETMGKLVDNGVALGLAAATFGTSYHTIAAFLSTRGFNGAPQYVGAACPDVLFFVGVREYLRDRRLGRPHKGWISFPVLVCTIGLFETLALNFLGLMGGVRDIWNSPLAFLVSGTMILVFMILHRRGTHHKIVNPADTDPHRVPQGWLIPSGVSAGPARVEWVSAAPVSGPGVSPDPIPSPSVSPDPEPETVIPEPSVSPDPGANWLEVINGGGQAGPTPGEGTGTPKGWTVDALVPYVRENWPVTQRGLRELLKTHPRGGAGQKTVVQAIKTVSTEHDTTQARRATGS